MPAPVRDKYYLRSLHEEIALFDRKLAHLLRYETFASEKDRNAAAAKMSIKRGQLAQAARELADSGIGSQSALSSSSVLTNSVLVEAEPIMPDSPAIAVLADAPAQESAPALTTASRFRDDIQTYLASRKKSRQN